MAYESVVWTPKTPITSDRLAKMQANIDFVKATVDGSTNSPTPTVGVGKGILHFETLLSNVTAQGWAGLGSSFSVVTEANRRYEFAIYCSRIHCQTGVAILRMDADAAQIGYHMVGMASNWDWAVQNGRAANPYASGDYMLRYVTPAAGTHTYQAYLGSLFSPYATFTATADQINIGYIVFKDVGSV